MIYLSQLKVYKIKETYKTQRYGTITNGQNDCPRFVFAAGKTVFILSNVRSTPDW